MIREIAAAPPRRQGIVLTLALGALAALGLPACAHPQKGPADTLAGFAAGLERKDYPAAYALMSADYRKRVALADFRAEIESAAGADVQSAARRIRESAPRAPLRIEIDVDLGDKLVLVMDGGQWRIAAQPFDLHAQKTPRAALRSFVRGIERKRYDVLLRLVPNRYRSVVTAETLRDYWEGERRDENRKLLDDLRHNMNAPIVESGDEARMPYGQGSEVHFLREDGLWKIEDPD
jgi:hypothetical protein